MHQIDWPKTDAGIHLRRQASLALLCLYLPILFELVALQVTRYLSDCWPSLVRESIKWMLSSRVSLYLLCAHLPFTAPSFREGSPSLDPRQCNSMARGVCRLVLARSDTLKVHLIAPDSSPVIEALKVLLAQGLRKARNQSTTRRCTVPPRDEALCLSSPRVRGILSPAAASSSSHFRVDLLIFVLCPLALPFCALSSFHFHFFCTKPKERCTSILSSLIFVP